MRPALETILQQLLRQQTSRISLDTIGDAIGAMRISPEEIEELIDAVEKAGKTVGDPSREVRQYLRPVIEQARQLKEQLHTTPSVEAIASATGLSVADVRTTLLYAQVLGR